MSDNDLSEFRLVLLQNRNQIIIQSKRLPVPNGSSTLGITDMRSLNLGLQQYIPHLKSTENKFKRAILETNNNVIQEAHEKLVASIEEMNRLSSVTAMANKHQENLSNVSQHLKEMYIENAVQQMNDTLKKMDIEGEPKLVVKLNPDINHVIGDSPRRPIGSIPAMKEVVTSQQEPEIFGSAVWSANRNRINGNVSSNDAFILECKRLYADIEDCNNQAMDAISTIGVLKQKGVNVQVIYDVCTSGPDHARSFNATATLILVIQDTKMIFPATGTSPTKKGAQKNVYQLLVFDLMKGLNALISS